MERTVTRAARLVSELTSGIDDEALAGELEAWMRGSSRFRAFVERHRDKIRKKLRSTRDSDALRDVRTELRVAHLLLGERRIELGFEAYGSTKGGPDFTVRCRGERPFNCEVTRLRRPPAEVTDGGPLLAKLRQLPPGMPNLLLVAIDGADAAALEVEDAVRALRRRADAKDEAFFRRRGLDGTRGFHARFLRLGGVVTWCEGGKADRAAALWTNPAARIAVPARAARASLSALREADRP